MKKSAILTVVVLIVIAGAIVFIVGKNKDSLRPNENGQIFQGSGNLSPRQENKFKPVLEANHTIVGNQLSINIGIEGASSSEGISGLAISLNGLPAYLSNPKIRLTEPGWNSNQSALQNGAVKFVANNVTNPIKNNLDIFATITFDVAASATDVKNQKADIEIEIVDSSPSAESYTFNRKIEIIAK